MTVSAKTDVGLVRSTNQDSYDFGFIGNTDITWAVVCDGMGGMAAGNIASEEAVKVISASLKNNLNLKASENFINNLLKSSIESANALVFDMAEQNPDLKGMGTTVVATAIINGVAYFAHAGDSRAYRYSNGNLFQITTDHSVVQTMVDNGQITETEAKNHPSKNIITRALGVNSYLDIDFEQVDLIENDLILLCSDGLTNSIDDELIEKTIKETEVNLLAERLIELANENGGKDNITVVAIKI